ncbi:hypothetical protein [Sphingomonas sp. 66-10]|uniref:hypothetical protein n=1 Tax=Sphingomonas sp. 66-10 TaxID=1895848 RepID=UPI002580C6E0|nr:hypothetical protein [Sphingomonas sp. 66-10]
MTMQDESSSGPSQGRFSPRRFAFLALLWLTIGAFAGFIVAGTASLIPNAWIPFGIVGFIVAGFALSGLLVRRVTRGMARIVKPAQGGLPPGRRVLARVDKLREAGLTVANFDHLFLFTLTVFPPEEAPPYETTIRQFITMGELPNFHTGRFLVFVEDPASPGYGLIEKEPPEDWQRKADAPPEGYRTQKAARSYPDRGVRLLGLGGDRPPAMSPARLAINIVTMLAFLAFGFLAPFALVTGGIETVTTFFEDLPKTLTGRNEGNFDRDKLRKAYDRAVTYAGDRPVETIRIYRDYVKLTVANPSQANAYDDVTLRGAISDSRPDGASYAIRPDETFRASETNFAMLDHALVDASLHGDRKKLIYIGFRTRSIPDVGRGTDDRATTGNRKSIVVTVGFDGDYGSTSRTYDAETGRFLD